MVSWVRCICSWNAANAICICFEYVCSFNFLQYQNQDAFGSDSEKEKTFFLSILWNQWNQYVCAVFDYIPSTRNDSIYSLVTVLGPNQRILYNL